MSNKAKTTTHGDVLNTYSLEYVKKIHNLVAPEMSLDEFLKTECDLTPKLKLGDLVVKPGDTPISTRIYLVFDFDKDSNEYRLMSFDSAIYRDAHREYEDVNKFIVEMTFHTAHIVEDGQL